jgi:hypothetical protein
MATAAGAVAAEAAWEGGGGLVEGTCGVVGAAAGLEQKSRADLQVWAGKSFVLREK